ncbi:MAG: hypothetical protein ACPGJV_06515 [Bacteriovoracaceae bacterium]
MQTVELIKTNPYGQDQDLWAKLEKGRSHKMPLRFYIGVPDDQPYDLRYRRFEYYESASRRGKFHNDALISVLDFDYDLFKPHIAIQFKIKLVKDDRTGEKVLKLVEQSTSLHGFND